MSYQPYDQITSKLTLTRVRSTKHAVNKIINLHEHVHKQYKGFKCLIQKHYCTNFSAFSYLIRVKQSAKLNQN